jgi:hypothetical protein
LLPLTPECVELLSASVIAATVAQKIGAGRRREKRSS